MIALSEQVSDVFALDLDSRNSLDAVVVGKVHLRLRGLRLQRFKLACLLPCVGNTRGAGRVIGAAVARLAEQVSESEHSVPPGA